MAIGSKSLLKSLSIYTFSNLLNAAIPFLLLPFLTNLLTPADYGLISIFQLILSLTIPFTGLNAEGAVSREFFSKEEGKPEFSRYVSNAIFLVVISSVVFLGLFIGFGHLLEMATDFPAPWLWVVIVCAFSTNISEILLSVWQVHYKSIAYSLFRILRTLVEMGLAIFLIVAVKNSWESRINSIWIVAVLFALVAFGFLYKDKFIKKGIDKKSIKGILQFGVPLIPHVIGAVLISMSDRLFITQMLGISETGLYAVGFQVAQVISLIQNSFNLAWVPWFYGKLNEDNERTKLKIVKFTYLYFLAMLVLVGTLTLGAPLLFQWFLGKEFSSAIQFVFWIALGFGFNGMYKMVVNYLFYLKQTHWVSVITFVTAGINLVMNYFLINQNGAVGAAQATAIAFFIQFIFVWILCAKKYKMPWLFFLHPKLT